MGKKPYYIVDIGVIKYLEFNCKFKWETLLTNNRGMYGWVVCIKKYLWNNKSSDASLKYTKQYFIFS